MPFPFGARLLIQSQRRTHLTLTSISDDCVLYACWIGIGCSVVVATGRPNLLLLLTMVFSYDGCKSFGGPWFGFAWESQLFEVRCHCGRTPC